LADGHFIYSARGRCALRAAFRTTKIEPVTQLWYERHRQTSRLTEIQTRHGLLNYEKDPKDIPEGVHGDILSHCRDVNWVHVRGCWVVDLLLGKE
jgi:hypothetical protein